jgi:hypothetical protein
MGLVALMAIGLAGCADTMAGSTTDHDTMAMKHGEHHTSKTVWISKEDGEQANYEIKVIASDGSDPIFVSSDDPDSHEFKEALKKLEEAGVVFNMDGDHKFILKHLEGLEGLEGLSELEDFAELKELAELKGFEGDHNVFIHKMHEANKVIELKDGHTLLELKEGENEWLSEDGKLLIIKKLDDGSGEKHEVHKKIIIRKVMDKDEKVEEELEDEDLK